MKHQCARDLSATPAAQLLDGAREIVKIAADHYLTVQSGILPIAYMSEALFTKMYSSSRGAKTIRPR